MYKVQETSKIAGVSVRTLHHYDHIGLLTPSTIGENRYRYYSDEDLKVLQQILFFKELGFSLKKIQEIGGNKLDQEYALKQHMELLQLKKDRITKLMDGVARTQEELAGGRGLTNEERFAPFVEDNTAFHIERYVKKEESAKKTTLTEETIQKETDSDEVGKEADRIYRTVAELMHLPADTPQIQQEMKAYYILLNRSYDCTPAVFRRLADLYVNDARFTASIDRHGEGLAVFLQRAMKIYADRLGYA